MSARGGDHESMAGVGAAGPPERSTVAILSLIGGSMASVSVSSVERNVTPSLGQYLAARTAPATGDTPSMDAEETE